MLQDVVGLLCICLNFAKERSELMGDYCEVMHKSEDAIKLYAHY